MRVHLPGLGLRDRRVRSRQLNTQAILSETSLEIELW